jgi:hypothetical protein
MIATLPDPRRVGLPCPRLLLHVGDFKLDCDLACDWAVAEFLLCCLGRFFLASEVSSPLSFASYRGSEDRFDSLDHPVSVHLFVFRLRCVVV